MTKEEGIQLAKQINTTKELANNNDAVIQKLQELRKTAMRGGISQDDIKWLVRELVVAADFRAEVYSDWLAADEAQRDEGQNGG